LALEIALIDVGQSLADDCRLEGTQTFVHRHQFHDRRPGIDQEQERTHTCEKA
jgi:hypothetical protein